MLFEGREWVAYDSDVKFQELGSAPGTPPSNIITIYAKDKAGASALYLKDDAGSEREIAAAGTVIGSGTADRLAYWSTATNIAAGSDLYWDNTNGRLGIGTSSPGAARVHASVAATGVGIKVISSSSLSAGQHIRLLDGGVDGTNNSCDIRAEKISASNDTALTFNTWDGSAYGERWRIHPSGYLHYKGGTSTTAATVIDIYSNNQSSIQLHSNADNWGATFIGFGAKSSISSPAVPTADTVLSHFTGGGYTGSGYSGGKASVVIKAAETFSGANQGSYLTLETTPTGSTVRAERFRVGPSGQLGIGGANYGSAGQYLRSTGSGSAPAWSTIPASEIGSGANVTAGSSKITLGGTPTGAALKAFSIDVNQANLDHGSIGGGTDDGHPRHVGITGRTGTSNDFVLSTTTNGTIYGSSASGGWLILTGTSHATKGLLVFGDSQYMDQANTTFTFAPTISNATANFVYYAISPVYTGSGNAFQGAKFAPVISPSASVATAYAFLGQGIWAPPTGVTITNAVSAFANSNYSDSAGAVSSGYAYYIGGPAVTGALKPTSQFGLHIENQGSSGISNAVGLSVAAQSGATNNWDIAFGRVDTTGGAGAYYGRIPVLYNGLTKYLRVYDS